VSTGNKTLAGSGNGPVIGIAACVLRGLPAVCLNPSVFPIRFFPEAKSHLHTLTGVTVCSGLAAAPAASSAWSIA